MERKEFENLLYNTTFDSISDEVVYKEKISKLRSWIKSNIPSKLYRYRTTLKQNFEAFEKNQLWGSSIVTFNDPLECLPYYNINTINEALQQEFSLETVLSFLDKIKNPTSLKQLEKFVNSNFLKKIEEEYSHISSEKIIVENLAQIYPRIIEYLQSIMSDLEYAFFNSIFEDEKTYKIACLSESNSSSLMWGHYAESHKGFCLEYDFYSILQDCLGNCSNSLYCKQFMMLPTIAPVIYKKERFDASSAFISMIMNHINDKCGIPSEHYFYDMLLPTKALLTKAEFWSYEKEWRVFKKEDDFSYHKDIFSIQPTAAYIGINMNTENKLKIKEICKSKKIPCYQMMPQYFNSSYEIVPIEVT